MSFVGFYVREHPKAQLTVILVLKRFRRRGRGFKSYPKALNDFMGALLHEL